LAKSKNRTFYDPEIWRILFLIIKLNINFEIENFIDQQVNTSADYTCSTAKPIEPFKKGKTFQKSSYWKMLDFNLVFTIISKRSI
jgi:hypothetical protein